MKLFYTGPSTADLHENYAKRGVVDENAPVRSTSTLEIDAPVAIVWQLITDMRAWPQWRTDAHVTQLDAVEVDAEFRWVINGMRIKALFATVDPEREIAWTGVALGCMRAIDRIRFEALDDGRTRVTMQESLAGPLLTSFYSSEKLRAGHEEMLRQLKTAAEAAAVRVQ
ncbi:SRPBCC domain-containing protein [Nocardia panacis]|uniref:SRPBCC domain-containing protein n=1 Tax=Nocardia panacis TaxID=2340916 RepID=A0A3A4KR37_9NOCA|nr:SRPBCC domain-containing protein [Nocardia panacis]RJO78471.1 SRPBCC domain-containing protein [Nocardia panacis]